MGVAGFARAGLAREKSGERWRALHEFLETGLNVVERVEVIHALSTAAQFPGSLRAAKQQDAEERDLAAVEVEDFLQAVFVLGDPAVGAADGSGPRVKT